VKNESIRRGTKAKEGRLEKGGWGGRNGSTGCGLRRERGGMGGAAL